MNLSSKFEVLRKFPTKKDMSLVGNLMEKMH